MPSSLCGRIRTQVGLTATLPAPRQLLPVPHLSFPVDPLVSLKIHMSPPSPQHDGIRIGASKEVIKVNEVMGAAPEGTGPAPSQKEEGRPDRVRTQQEGGRPPASWGPSPEPGHDGLLSSDLHLRKSSPALLKSLCLCLRYFLWPPKRSKKRFFKHQGTLKDSFPHCSVF